jgi:hypothetical protein
VDLSDRLRVERATRRRVTAREQLGVEPLEVLGAQVSERDATDAVEHVELDVAAVAVPRARSQRQLLEREPLPREIAAKCRSGRARAGAGIIGELARQQLSVVATGAGGVPAAPLSSGDRVEHFVDDGVEPLPSLHHVTAHRALAFGAHGARSGGRHRWNAVVPAGQQG